MWIILEAEPEAFLYYGFEKEVSKEEFEERINNNTLTEILHKQPVKAGEVYYIPAGTIHAIGAGIVLAEVQQSSNSTYRVYDFGRRGADGKLRPLHIQKALDVTEMKPANFQRPGAQEMEKTGVKEILIDCEFFAVTRLRNLENYSVNPEGKFIAFLCVESSAQVQCEKDTLVLQKGECIFVPATSPQVTVSGHAEILQIQPGKQ